MVALAAVVDPNVERFLGIHGGFKGFVISFKGVEEPVKDRNPLVVLRAVNDRVDGLRAERSVIPNLDTPSFRETSVTYHRSETAGC